MPSTSDSMITAALTRPPTLLGIVGRAPGQDLIDGLMDDAQGVADAFGEVFGSKRVMVVIQVSDVPAETYHELPHAVTASTPDDNGVRHTWKTVARARGLSHAYVLCADSSLCPERQDAIATAEGRQS